MLGAKQKASQIRETTHKSEKGERINTRKHIHPDPRDPGYSSKSSLNPLIFHYLPEDE